MESIETLATDISCYYEEEPQETVLTAFPLPRSQKSAYTKALDRATDFNQEIYSMYGRARLEKVSNDKEGINFLEPHWKGNFLLDKTISAQDKMIFNSWFNLLGAVFLDATKAEVEKNSFVTGLEKFYQCFSRGKMSKISQKIKHPLFNLDLWKHVDLLKFLNTVIYNLSLENSFIYQCKKVSFLDTYFAGILFQKYFWKLFASELQDPNNTSKVLEIVFRYLNPLFIFLSEEEISQLPPLKLERTKDSCLQLVYQDFKQREVKNEEV